MFAIENTRRGNNTEKQKGKRQRYVCHFSGFFFICLVVSHFVFIGVRMPEWSCTLSSYPRYLILMFSLTHPSHSNIPFFLSDLHLSHLEENTRWSRRIQAQWDRKRENKRKKSFYVFQVCELCYRNFLIHLIFCDFLCVCSVIWLVYKYFVVYWTCFLLLLLLLPLVEWEQGGGFEMLIYYFGKISPK